jgi:arylsulfatase
MVHRIFIFIFLFFSLKPSAQNRPNVVIVMTDDQGIGDFGFTGNPYVQTPTLDKLASESQHLTQFYVSPVCSPTRASLMTGRYSARTGVYDTYNGGSTMSTTERTVAEYFKVGGYQTGIFGKWHLGDNYPSRPSDQGFDESLIHKSGGMGQVGDIDNYFAFDSAYFNPVLYRNNERVKTKGYCSDVFTNGAINFVNENADEPFLLYLSFNAPHTPLQLPQEYLDKYADLEAKINAETNPDFFPNSLSDRDIESAKRVYGMVTNIDDNINRLIKTLKQKGIYDTTIFVFLTDNGPQQNRYKMGLRGRKGQAYEGGVHVPCLIRYPKIGTGKVSHNIAHFDLLPTILEMTNLPSASDIDGSSFYNLLKNESDGSLFDNRPIVMEWQRGLPERYRNVAVRKGNYKWVGNANRTAKNGELELFDFTKEITEETNIIETEKELSEEYRHIFDEWFTDDIIRSENLRYPVGIHLGSPQQSEVTLNRNDMGGMPGIWAQDEIFGYWRVEVEEEGSFDIEINFLNEVQYGRLLFKAYPTQISEIIGSESTKSFTLKDVYLPKGKYQLECWFDKFKNETIGQEQGILTPFWVTVKRK